MKPYLHFVEGIEAGVIAAKGISVSGKTEVVESESKVLIFSPHPDDECIIGLLPLRLMREAGKQVVNIPVTFGSNPERQAGREKELEDACAYLGWTLHKEQQGYRSLAVEDVVRILEKFKPEIIFIPHDDDWNSRHISTHHLVVDALKKMPADFTCNIIENEFWGAMDDPNLLVEGDAKIVADLVAATSLHVEEVNRNPYHLLLPAWMQDNVRRGGELVGGQGGVAPDFSFATLYRFRRWADGAFQKALDSGRQLPMGKQYLKELI